MSAKPNAMTTTKKIAGTTDETESRRRSTQTPSLLQAVRFNYIATAAYHKAEARGFDPGHELDDWLEAEAEFDEERRH